MAIDVGGELAAMQGLSEGKETEEVKDISDVEDAVDEVVKEEDSDDDSEDKKESEADETDESEDTEDSTEAEEDEEVEESEDSIINQLKARDPKLLKEIPTLRHIIFREEKYTEIFPTVEDARGAAEAVDTLVTYERDLAAGNSENLLEALSKSKKNFENFVGNFLPTLEKQNEHAYLQVIYPELKKAFKAFSRNSDPNIALSAKNLHIAIFGNANFDESVGYKPKVKNEDEEELTKQKQEFEGQKLQFFAQDVEASIHKSLRIEIAKTLKSTGLTDFVKNAAEKKIIEEVDKLIVADKRHMGNISSLWRQAKQNGFTPNWKDSIRNAYLSRAKGLLPKVRQTVLAEAGAKIVSDKTNTKKQPIRVSGTNTSNSTNAKPNYKDIDWGKDGYSEIDYISGKTPPLKVKK